MNIVGPQLAGHTRRRSFKSDNGRLCSVAPMLERSRKRILGQIDPEG